MKTFIAAISFILYFAATSGIVINSHYCMKKLVSVRLFETKAKMCGQCGMDLHDNGGCCTDETKVLKLVQDQVKIPVTTFQLPSLDVFTTEVSDFFATSVYKVNGKTHFNNHSPPLLSAQDTYLQISVFRI
ncbi:MAG: hypothetical protein FJY20_00540 [Bacteroidetes bacterium]|nr:hypothetical protein [Bacteroidota bacterium]